MHRRVCCQLVAAAILVCFSLAAQTVTPTIVTVGSVPRGVAIDGTGTIAIVGNSADNSISLVNLKTGSIAATITSVSSPAGIAVNTTTGFAVIANQFNNSVTVLDVTNRRVVATIPVGSSPVGVAVNPTTNVAVVANSTGNSVSVVNLSTLTQTSVIEGIPTPTGLQAVAVDADLNVAAVASSSSNSLFLVDLSKNQITNQVSVEQLPTGVAIDPLSKIAVVTNNASNSVSFVGLGTVTPVLRAVPVPQPQMVAISPGLGPLVTTGSNSTLEVLSMSGVSLASITNLPLVTGVAFSAKSGQTVVTLPSNNAIAIIGSLGAVSSVNAASFLPGAVAPLSIASAFGTGLAASTVSASTVPLPTLLSNVAVRVGNTVVPLFFVSPLQINFEVPQLLPGTYAVQVLQGNTVVATGSLQVASTSPAIFTVNMQGTGQAAALDQDFTLNGPLLTGSTQKPATRGSAVMLFGTGGGFTSPTPATGSASMQAARTVLTATATVGGVRADVQYSGAAPGLVGAWQVNVIIPATVTPGSAVPVTVTIGGQTSNQVTIAVE